MLTKGPRLTLATANSSPRSSPFRARTARRFPAANCVALTHVPHSIQGCRGDRRRNCSLRFPDLSGFQGCWRFLPIRFGRDAAERRQYNRVASRLRADRLRLPSRWMEGPT